jgi:DedD protein
MPDHPNIHEIPADSGDLRGQLLKRLMVAGAIVALLLGILAVFDQLVSIPEESEEADFSRPVPVPQKKVITQPVTSAPPEPPVTEDQAPATPPPPPPPVVDDQPVVPPATATPKAVSDTPTVNRSPASVSRSTSLAGTKAVASSEKPPVPELTTPPASVSAPVVQPPAPGSGAAQRSETASLPSPKVPSRRLFSGFVVQAGVFSSAQRAEELQAQLQLGGVPATLETRVQVGPFKTRQEAEAAQEKLKKMGIESLLVPPKGSKN